MARICRIGASMLALAVTCSLLGCASLAPPRAQVRSLLTPIPGELAEGYSLQEDGALVYQREGMKVTVRYVADQELNAMFPEHSDKGAASTNPYTYGNWVDPELGYSPNRFTVFKVTVHNYTLPKINLNPAEALLISDRGDQLRGYVREAEESEDNPSFQEYYRERMVRSGVEENRLVERMGLVRQTLYVNGKAFKKDMKEGFLAFDPLDSRVKKVDLVLKNFVLAYDANDWPVELIDLTFPFERKIEEETTSIEESADTNLKNDISAEMNGASDQYAPRTDVDPNEKRKLNSQKNIDLLIHETDRRTAPRGMTTLTDYIESNINIKADVKLRTSLDSNDLMLRKIEEDTTATKAPSKVHVRSQLVPLTEKLSNGYSLQEDGTVVYQRQGMKVTVRYIADQELNAMFPEHSNRGAASTNPYTYGNWVDPELGYSPNRFTVFKVTVHNYTLPKINLNPAEALLISDRGDQLRGYVRESEESEDNPSFQDYYRERMARSGVEENRLVERMGLVRQTLYVDGKAFKKDMKEGFLAFDPLDSRVKRANLVLKDFVLAYDANDWPIELVDLTFPFERIVEETTRQTP